MSEGRDGVGREQGWWTPARTARTCVLKARRAAEEDGLEPGMPSSGTGVCFGLSICRAPMHPFSWVSAVAEGGAAEEAGLAVGDCLLRVCSTPLFGLPVRAVALALLDAAHPGRQVQLFYWRPSDVEGAIATPRVLPQVDRLLAAVTCPVCFEAPICNPATQCTNGHLLCLRCRRRSARCPICRTPLRTPSGVPLGGRCLLADQIRTAFFAGGDLRAEEARGPAVDPECEREKCTAAIASGRKHRGGGGARALLRRLASWLLHSRGVRPPTESEAPLAEGDIYRLCAAM